MEAVGVIFILIALGLLVLQILMIVKFFQIAADVRGVKNLLAEQFKKEPLPETSPETRSEGVLPPYSEISTPPYQVEGDNVVFEDGVYGTIMEKFGAFSFEGLQGKRIFCKTQEEAIKGLYHTLTHSAE
ncbi:hypothetical protein [uncultured Rikenella sp.]|uniref:hypothetical protein n=1 Tax=uncultured Rikenella sp. TaxID=368003 RepID=UPI002602BC85|nr:hypothetical protein [uncultured Rikenella sp.]